MSLKAIYQSIKNVANSQRAAKMMYFFKTKQGEYGHGDIFVGISNPDARIISKENKTIQYKDIHEERFIGLLILIQKYKKQEERKTIYQFYLNNLKAVNNWDLVDLSAPNIIGNYLLQSKQSRQILYTLSKSSNLWERRISILSTFPFIKHNDFQDTLNISKILLEDKHDLIHKGVGWMLRQVGSKNSEKLQYFLKENYDRIPRTALRYAIEKFEEKKRKKYLKKQF